MSIWYLVPLCFVIAGPGVAGIIIAASGETAVFFINAASFLGVIAVLSRQPGRASQPDRPDTVRLAGRTGHAAPPDPRTTAVRRFRWLLDLPRPVQAAAAMALLIGGFGLQFAVTNPLMASRVFHLGSVGFGLFGTFMAVGGIVGNYYSSHRKDPGPLEFMAWSLVFGAAECLAAVMPVAWAYDVIMVALAATQLFAASATVYVLQATPAADSAGPRCPPTTRDSSASCQPAPSSWPRSPPSPGPAGR
jgi:hypothetical protein